MTKRVMIHRLREVLMLLAAVLQTLVCALLFGRIVAAIVVGVQVLMAWLFCCMIRAPDRD